MLDEAFSLKLLALGFYLVCPQTVYIWVWDVGKGFSSTYSLV